MFTAWTQIFKRDLLIAFRRRSEIVHPIIFFVMVISLFPLAIGDDKALLQKIAPAIIWVTALLATMLSLDNLFRSDFEDGSL
jgi:heme exporter protein B